MVIGIKWFHFIVSFLREAPSFFRTTGAGKWLRAFGDPSHQASFFLKAPGIRRLSVLLSSHRRWLHIYIDHTYWKVVLLC